MSLRVWLPLTKDLRQQGLLNVTATNNGATYLSSGGKLGGTYSATASGQTITIDFVNLSTMLANGKTYTLTCWVKPTGTPSNGWVIKLGNNNCGLWWAKSEARWVWNENDNGKRCANPTISADYTNWHHLAIVVDKTVSGKITTQQYVDGVLAAGYPGSTWDCSSHSQPAGTVITISPYVSQLNDIRLYDHCLSPMEVKELAKGLVLHYPLNRQGWGQENLLLNSNDLTLWPIESSGKIELQEDGYFKVSSKASNTTRYGIYYDFTFPEPNTYTFSVDVRDDWLIGVAPASTFAWTTANLSGTQGKKRISYTCVSTEENNKCRIYIAGTGTGGRVTYLKHPKLEKGSIATPWCPNSSDTLATTMDLNSTIEYDCSGFCNNGTRTGTFTWTSDTPKYAVSQVFNGTDNAIQTPNLTTMITDKNYTIACWTYKTVIGTKNYQTIYGGPSGFELEARSSSSTSPLYRIHNWGGGTTAYNFGEWTHFCFVHTDSDSKLYVNGELKITGTSVNVPSGNYFVGAWNTSTSQNYEGNMSDFRIYATALSADDVKSLYQNSAYIDSSGNVYGAVHSEV